MFSWALPKEFSLVGQPMKLNVLFEDDHVIVIDKPAGLVVHPSPGHPDGTLVNGLLDHCATLSQIGDESRPGIVHRIDKDTSGILVVAKSDSAHEKLAAQFKEKTAEREYIAFVAPAPRVLEGTFNTLIGRHPRNRKKFSTRVAEGKTAVTHFRVLAQYGKGDGGAAAAAKISCKLETGRTHQIRVHCTDAGHPIIGDQMYSRGAKHEPLKTWARELGRQALHATNLGFSHPHTGEDLKFDSLIPDDMSLLANRLENWVV